MPEFLSLLFGFFKSTLSGQRDLALENLALRQQLAILKRTQKRPTIGKRDRLFWVWLSQIWSGRREALIVIKPETVINWLDQGFRLFWTWLSRRKVGGRPTVKSQTKALIKQIVQANPLYGAPRIHSELLKLSTAVECIGLNNQHWTTITWPGTDRIRQIRPPESRMALGQT